MSAPAAHPTNTPPPAATHPAARRGPSAAGLRLRLAIVAGVLLLADLGLAGWLLSPYAPSRAATQQQLAEAQSTLSAMQHQDRQLRSLSTQVRIGEQQAEQLLSAGMPLEAGASSQLLFELQRIAAKCGIQISGATFQADTDVHSGLRRLRIQVSLNGSYDSVVRFLNQVEQSPIFFIINQVNASSLRTAASPAAVTDVRLQVEIEAYEQVGGGASAGQTSKGGAR